MTRDDAKKRLLATQLLIAKWHPDLVLSPVKAELFDLVHVAEFNTTGELAEVTGKSVCSISTTLKKMYDASFLDRRQIIQASGGLEWEYYIT